MDECTFTISKAVRKGDGVAGGEEARKPVPWAPAGAARRVQSRASRASNGAMAPGGRCGASRAVRSGMAMVGFPEDMIGEG